MLGAVRPISLSDSGVGRKGKAGEVFGPNKLGLVWVGGVGVVSFIDLKTSDGLSLAKAQERTEMEEEGAKLGGNVLEGELRGDLATMSPEEVIRAAATDEALLSEASRYGDVSHLAGGRGFSSPSSSSLGRTLVKGGSFGLGRGEAATTDGIMVPLRLQMPMRLLLVESDSQDRVMGGGKLLSLEDGGRCVCLDVEGLSQEERWTGGS